LSETEKEIFELIKSIVKKQGEVRVIGDWVRDKIFYIDPEYFEFLIDE
jgi:tRNA nucleotidyltransferase/poly(A) polymerase